MLVFNGMEHARQWSTEKGVWHHAIIDYADRLGLLGYARPVIIELVPDGMRARPFDPAESWQRTAIEDVDGASHRLRKLFEMEERRRYDWFSNNCEHIARYISSGEFKSEQVQGVVAIGLVGLLLLALREAA